MDKLARGCGVQTLTRRGSNMGGEPELYERFLFYLTCWMRYLASVMKIAQTGRFAVKIISRRAKKALLISPNTVMDAVRTPIRPVKPVLLARFDALASHLYHVPRTPATCR